MLKFIISIIVILFPINVFGIAYTSNVGGGSGFWDVGASWNPVGVPFGGAGGDTATIVAGDTIRVRQDQSIGTNPAVGTFDLQVSGTLIIEDPVGVSTTFTANTSTRILVGGKISIGLVGAKISCVKYVIWDLITTANKYYIRVDNGGSLDAFGCEGFPSVGANSNIRARIASCAPNCNAGAGVVLTLDSNIDWASAGAINPVTGGNHEVIIGSGGGATNPAAFGLAEIAQITAYPAVNQITVTLANNHQVGDIVANPTRNILFRSSAPANHGYIINNGGSYNLNWARTDEMGDGTTTTAAIVFNLATGNLGTIEYFATTNCEDGAAVTAFYTNCATWDSFKNNIVYDINAGKGVIHEGDTTTVLSLGWWTIVKGVQASGTFIAQEAGDDPMAINEVWLSECSTCIKGPFLSITDSLIHNIGLYGIQPQLPLNYYNRLTNSVIGCELRNSPAGSAARGYFPATGQGNVYLANNDFDSMRYECLGTSLGGSITYLSMHTYNNTFDNCAWGSVSGDVCAYGMPIYIGSIRSDRDKFGLTSPNRSSNICFNNTLLSTTTLEGHLRFIINEPDLTIPNNAYCWPDPICLYNYTSFDRRAGVGNNTFVSVQNSDLVTDAIFTWGPGGCTIQRENVTILNGTLRMHATPFAADRYAWIPIGSIQVDNGDNLTVKLWLRKDEAQVAGSRPRLALEGCGFYPLETGGSYDEMSDAINTWEEVQVTGTTNANGSVHIYLLIKGNENGGGLPFEPVNPPTLEIYADKISYTKS